MSEVRRSGKIKNLFAPGMEAVPREAPPQVFRAAEAPSRVEETPNARIENQVRSKKGLSGQPGSAP